MRVLFLASLAGALAVGAAATAQPSAGPGGRDAATLCLDGIGVSHPAICHKQQASRFPSAPDICHCNGPYRTVKAPYCAPGERPPADTADFDRARISYANDHGGNLFGFTYQGQTACVPMSPG